MSSSSKSPERPRLFQYSEAGLTINFGGVFSAIRNRAFESRERRQIGEIDQITSTLKQGRFRQAFNGYAEIDVKDEAVTVTTSGFDFKTEEPVTTETRVSRDLDGGHITQVDQIRTKPVITGAMPEVDVRHLTYVIGQRHNQLDLKDVIRELHGARDAMIGAGPRPAVASAS